MPRKNIVKELQINEISCVDVPAQEGAQMMVMKRGAQEEHKQSDLLTSEEDGHQHGVEIYKDYDGRIEIYISSSMGSNELQHTHPIVYEESNGYVIGSSAGHTHTVDQTGLSQRVLTYASKGGNEMSDDTEMKAQLDEAKKAIDEMRAELNKANQVASLSPEEKAYYDDLDAEWQDKFLGESAEKRKSIVLKAKEGNPVIYKSLDGVEFRKEDDPALVAMAKSNDELRKSNAALTAKFEEVEVRKTAAETLKYLPGDEETKVSLIKAVNAIVDDEQREKAMQTLKAHNAQFEEAHESKGVGGETKVDSEWQTAVDKKIDEYRTQNPGKSYEQAYAHVTKSTKEGIELLKEQIVN